MKKTTFDKALLGFLGLVAILFMGVTLSSCSNDDDVPVDKRKKRLVPSSELGNKT